MLLDDERRIMTQPNRSTGLPSETSGLPPKKPACAARFACFARMFFRTKGAFTAGCGFPVGKFVINL
jgi:hypothetical protein